MISSRNVSTGRPSRRSESRGSQLNYRELSGIKPVTRGRSHTVGNRRLKRWLNDNMVYAYGNIWDGLSEYEFQERLAHMHVDITKKPSVFEELQSMGEETKEMFRDGTLGMVEEKKPPGPRRLTIRGALESMYTKIYPRCRALLLREARRTNSLMEAGSDIKTITSDIEYFLMLLLDGKLSNVIEEHNKQDKDSTDEPKYSPFPCGPEFESCLVDYIRVLQRQSLQMGNDKAPELTGVERPFAKLAIDSSTSSATQEHHDYLSKQLVYEVPIVDGHSRMMFIGLAQFYGVGFEVLEDSAPGGDSLSTSSFKNMFPSAKIVRFWLKEPNQPTFSEGNNVEVVLAIRRQLHAAMLAAAAAVQDSEGGKDPLESMDNQGDEFPYVPLFAVHVRTITEESMAPRKTKKQFTYGARFRSMRPKEQSYSLGETNDIQMITQDMSHLNL